MSQGVFRFVAVLIEKKNPLDIKALAKSEVTTKRYELLCMYSKFGKKNSQINKEVCKSLTKLY